MYKSGAVNDNNASDEQYNGKVAKGTPICLESERIMLRDELGNQIGQIIK